MGKTAAARSGDSKGLAYLYEIRPVPMLATLLAALLGALYAATPGSLDLTRLPVYLLAVAAALYCGHALDSLVDYHRRGETKFVYMGFFEDSGGLLSERELAAAAFVASAIWLIASLSLAPPGSALFAVSFAGFVIAALYSFALDRHPVTVSLAYPAGTALAMVGGFLLAGGTDAFAILAIAVPIFVYLVGGKIVSDQIDFEADSAIAKRTVVVVLGRERAKWFGYSLCVAALIVALASAGLGYLPMISTAGIAGASILLFTSFRMEAAKGVLALVAGGYVFLISTIAPLIY
ncbi:MAG: UbiA family prenyltransferase [Euryarchaeota archaeon]|nr:UbiA family prenyltransferase [Euryarchaeota archaeon]